jgi:hypothetical protein
MPTAKRCLKWPQKDVKPNQAMARGDAVPRRLDMRALSAGRGARSIGLLTLPPTSTVFVSISFRKDNEIVRARIG